MKLKLRKSRPAAAPGLRPIPEEFREVIDLSEPTSAAGLDCPRRFGKNSRLVRDRRHVGDGQLVLRAKNAPENVSIRIGRIVGKADLLVTGNDVTVDIGYCEAFNIDFILGVDSDVSIGDDCTIGGVRMLCRYSGVKIGNDCMLSRHIMINSAQHHGVVDLSRPRPKMIEKRPVIEIGDHVWLGQHCAVMGNATIGAGSILGAFAVTAGKLPANVIAAGNPAVIKSRDRTWSRLSRHFDDRTKTYLEGLDAK